MEFTAKHIDVWTANRDAQAAVRSVAAMASENTYDTEPRPVTVDMFPGATDTTMLQAILRPEFFHGPQGTELSLERAPISLEIFDEKTSGSDLPGIVATVHSDRLLVSSELFGFAADNGPYHAIWLNNPDATSQELAAVDQIGKLLFACAGW